MKRIACLILSIMMVLSFWAGCQAEADVSTNPPTAIDSPLSSVPEQAPADRLEFDNALESTRVVVDGVVHYFDVQVLDDVWYISAQDAQTVFDGTFTGDYVDLEAYARDENIRYIKDEVLTAAYINTWKPYDTVRWEGTEFSVCDDGIDFERAFYMGLVDESLRDRADEQIISTQFRTMLAELISAFAPDAIEKFDQNVTSEDMPLARKDGILMAYYAAVCLGVDTYNVGFDSNIAYPNGWNEATAALFPNWNRGPAAYRWENSDADEYWDFEYDAALFWAIGRRSTVTSTLMFTLDSETGDMNIDGPLTVRDAVSVLMRLHDGVGGNSFREVSAELLAAPSPVLSGAHIEKANKAPAVTAENHPRWTGFALEWSESFANLSEDNIYHLANWGFNSVRINLSYRNLFNTDGETYLSNLANLQKLDSYIATAIECGLHVDLCLTDQPGREEQRLDGFETWGDFDLFVNPEKQEKSFWVWETLSVRYKDIPSSYLSFSPIWEEMNPDLTTGLGAPEYTMEDVGVFFAKLIDVIREQDEDRMITYELNGGDKSLDEPIVRAVADKTNILANYNFVDQPFAYYTMRVPEDGGDGDNVRHSSPIPVYPTYLYSTCRFIKQDDSIHIDGCLPAGTVINLYLKESFGSILEITADGAVLYSEDIPVSSYPVDYRRSVYHIYAQSEKCISVTLEKDTDLIVLAASGDGVEWSGMDVILPEEYARDYWYYNSEYDQFIGLTDTSGMAIVHDALITIAPTQDGLGVGAPRDDEAGRNITIHEDVTYTTDVLWMESSADSMKEYISASCTAVGGDPLVRLETPYFSAAAWEDVVEYYSDAFSVMENCSISWWSNDFPAITSMSSGIGGAEYMEYSGFLNFNIEFLKLLQQYQNTEGT